MRKEGTSLRAPASAAYSMTTFSPSIVELQNSPLPKGPSAVYGPSDSLEPSAYNHTCPCPTEKSLKCTRTPDAAAEPIKRRHTRRPSASVVHVPERRALEGTSRCSPIRRFPLNVPNFRDSSAVSALRRTRPGAVKDTLRLSGCGLDTVALSSP